MILGADVETRRCVRCKKWLPLTEEFFPKDSSRPKGLGYQCKEDTRARGKEHYAKPEIRKARLDYALRRRKEEKKRQVHRRYYAKHKAQWQGENGYVKQRTTRQGGVTPGSAWPIPREELVVKYKGVCQLCGKKVRKGQESPDHIVPVSRGGSHTADNIQLAHVKCNRRRGSKLLSEIPVGYFP